MSGKTPFTASDVAKLSQAMARGDMPPLQYILLHWDSALNEKEQKILVQWIRKRTKEYDLRPIPNDNFFNPDLQKAELGKALFNDKRLSGDGTVSCASCHDLNKGGTDQLANSLGVSKIRTGINTPTVLNSAYNFAQYWDGRVSGLKAQAASAIVNPIEMNSNWSKVIAALLSERKYLEQFNKCYPAGINQDTICDAIAEYEHTLLTPGSRFDKFLLGDLSALSTAEKSGYQLFKKYECYTCHSGPALGGESFEKLGIEKDYFASRSLTYDDKGRANVTHSNADLHKFKVPILRNVALTFPYFHDGSVKTLEEAVKLMSTYQTRKTMSDEECKDVAAFLRTLTGSAGNNFGTNTDSN